MPEYIAKDYYGKFSPIVKHGIPDYDRESEAWDKWVEEQSFYFDNGYDAGGDHITGKHYFQLNFTKRMIADADGYKQPQSPYYVDIQREFYDTVDRCAGWPGHPGNGKNIVVIKGRDKGLTDEFASICLFETQLRKNTDILALFPGGQSQALAKFKLKFNLSYNDLLEDFKRYPGLKDTEDIRHYGFQIIDGSGHKKNVGINSSITTIHAVDADVGKSGRYKWIFIDELGEILEPLKLIETNRANMQEGIKKTGITIAGGTVNAFKGTGYRDCRTIRNKHEEMDIEFIFIPAQRGFWGCVNLETGQSDEATAKAYIDKIAASKTGQDLMIYQQNYPTSEEQAFMVISNSPFDSAKIEKRIRQIETDKVLQQEIQVGDLVWTTGDRVKFELNPKGWWKIYRHPDRSLEFSDVIAVDSYRISDVAKSDVVSKGAIMVRRTFQGANKEGSMTIAILRERPDDKDDFFEECIKAEIYWNAQALIEYTDQDIFKYHETHKAIKYVYKRPEVLEEVGRKSFKVAYKWGVKPSPEAKKRGTEIAVIEFNHTWENEPFIEVLEDLNNFTDENVDLGMCYVWSTVHALDRVSNEPVEAARDKFFIPGPYRLKSGQVMFISTRKQYNALKGKPMTT